MSGLVSNVGDLVNGIPCCRKRTIINNTLFTHLSPQKQTFGKRSLDSLVIWR
jgi:hypothetical protein